MEPIQTNRLIIRYFESQDLDDFYTYAKVEGVGERAGWKHHQSKKETKEILDIFIEHKDVYAVVLKENNKVIGSIGLHKRDDQTIIFQEDEYYLGYVLSKDYWQQGLMSEAVGAFIDAVFKRTQVHVLVAGHFAENIVSKKILLQFGFIYKRNAKYHSKSLNQTFDSLEYYLTKTRYNHQQSMKEG